jgi:hypothetical protein
MTRTVDTKKVVMPRLDRDIHVEARPRRYKSFRAIALSWMAGSSPAMTVSFEVRT